jgi:surface polysaccharide O-acyltransferase-like enzyme
MEKTKKQMRISNIELLRFFSILLVVLHHVAIHTNWINGNSDAFLAFKFLMILGGKVGVDLFVIISGYLLINSRAKVSSLSRTIAETAVFSIVMYLFVIIFNINGNAFSFSYLIKRIFPVAFNDYWFVTAYVLMYLFLPLILPTLKSMSRDTYRYTLIIGFVVVFIWPLIWLKNGMNFSYPVFFVYLFTLGGGIKKFDIKIKPSIGIGLATLFSVLGVIATFLIRNGLSLPHNRIIFKILDFFGWTTGWRENIFIWFDASPLPLLIAFCLFTSIMSLPYFYNNMINYFGKHVFGAYLFQSAPLFSPWIYQTFIDLNRVHGTILRVGTAIAVAIVLTFIGIILHTVLAPVAKKYSQLLSRFLTYKINKEV